MKKMMIKQVVHCTLDPATGKIAQKKLNNNDLKQWLEENIKEQNDNTDDKT